MLPSAYWRRRRPSQPSTTQGVWTQGATETSQAVRLTIHRSSMGRCGSRSTDRGGVTVVWALGRCFVVDVVSHAIWRYICTAAMYALQLGAASRHHSSSHVHSLSTGWAKKVSHYTESISSLNINNFFTSHARHTYYVAALPCKTWMSKNQQYRTVANCYFVGYGPI